MSYRVDQYGRRVSPAKAPTARVGQANGPGVLITCKTCQFTFRPSFGITDCPICERDVQIEGLRRDLYRAIHERDLVTDDAARMRRQLDLVVAMREAIDITGAEDMAYIKSVLYQWRDSKSVNLKVTHAPPPNRHSAAPPNGFLAIQRNGDMHDHKCTSPGGIALAGYFEEASRTTGPVEAMKTLIKALNSHLPGAL